MDWWQPLVGVILGSIATYCFTRLGARQERKSIERERLRNAVRNILAELETNLKLAQEPFRGRLVPFPTYMWDPYKGYTLGLPKHLQETLRCVYVEIHMANALFQLNLRLPYGSGYYDKDYVQQREKIVEEAQKTASLLVAWLEQEGVEVPVV